VAEIPQVHWSEGGEARTAPWHSERGLAPPKRVLVVDDRITADDAFGQACQGVALLWRGDFQNARQMLRSLANRADWRPRPAAAAARPAQAEASAAAFHLERQARAQRARTLGSLLVELDADYGCTLRRAPELRQSCIETFGAGRGPRVLSLRELLGIIGAREWRIRGIEIPAAGLRIHPHYGVFAPIRHEYVALVAQAPLPAALASVDLAFDIGTGTGVLAAVLARRGIARVLATDQDPRALVCARDNLERLGLDSRVELLQADLFPAGHAGLVVCNPPWIPARPGSPLERAVYDPDSRMLLGFLDGLRAHLAPGGEAWLVLSDLAEHLGLRARSQLLDAFQAAGLTVLERIDTRPTHPRAADAGDALHAARRAEVTSLWRLGAA
jgi:methylase of polypeptide subunit release factors